jgi:hypothetical protein
MQFESKLKELFQKYIDVSSTRPGEIKWKKLCEKENIQYKESDIITKEMFDDEFEHQLEYLNWMWDNEKIKFYGICYNQSYTLLGIFCDQDDKIELIRKEFEEYLLQAKQNVLKIICENVNILKQQDIPCSSISITQEWSSLFNDNTILGMEIIDRDYISKNSIAKIESSEQYGKFVMIKILNDFIIAY